jgi:predicted ArsR family transcriptional regulator
VDIRATASTGNRPVESSTRERVLRDISTLGPITTSTLVERLGLTETAVRRHVENLHAEGLIEGRDQVGQRGRGRPARAWVLSAQGHAHLRSDYDHLAEGAIRFLATHAGRGAVRSFADERARGLAQRCQEQMPDANAPVAERTAALVTALQREGYAASARPVAVPGAAALTGIQLCQGHCPVQHVAAEFPEFCDAETEAFSELLGVHVQRLATLAQGDHVCTTFVPGAAAPVATTEERSQS